MDSQARHHIQEWLFRTTEERRDTTNMEGALPEIAFAGTRIQQATIDSTDLSINGANKLKRRRQSDVDLTGCNYGRRARHKTKEDRYEYKGKGACRKDISGAKEKKKAANRIRKHTINDDFHASCVPASRLTLRRPFDMGIFKNGRTSTPIRSRRVSAVFSEVDFLSRCSFANERLPTAQGRNTKCLGNQSTVRVSERPRPDHISSTLQRGKGAQEPPCFSPNHKLTGNVGGEDDIEESLETCTKELLSFDLNAWETREWPSKASSSKTYWTLEDLTFLLEERTKSWSPSPSQKQRKCKPSQSLDLKASMPQQSNNVGRESLGGQTEGICSVKPRLDDVTLNPPGSFLENPNSVSDEIEQDRLCWSPRCDQESHEFMDFDQESTFSANLANQACNEQLATRTTNECENYGTEMLGIETEWTYDGPSISNILGDVPVVGHCDDLIINALDEAYEMIVDSDKGYLGEAIGDRKLKTMEDSIMGDNETIRVIHQGCQVFGIASEKSPLISSLFGGATRCELSRPSFGQQNQLDGIHQSSRTGESSEMGSYTRQPPVCHQGHRSQLLNSEELLHGLKGFWRQNKLY